MRPRLPGAFWMIIIAMIIARTAFFVESFLTIFMKSEAGFSSALAAFIMGLYGFGGAAAAFSSGPLIDRLGPRIPLLVSLLATAAAAVVLALGPPNWSLALIVLAFGLVGQVIQPASNAYIAQLVPDSRRREAYSWSFIALNSGLAIGPLLGGYLAGVDFSLMFGTGATLIVIGALFAAAAKPARQHGLGAATARPLEPARPMASMRELLRDRVFVEYTGLNWLFMVLYLQVFVILPCSCWATD
ncbi:MFS transporter [Leucobacter soli]|uniref:MFS transporter n=1 Tax=Leucobacter soli TaxID=2812850 RepID=UPI00361DAD2B